MGGQCEQAGADGERVLSEGYYLHLLVMCVLCICVLSNSCSLLREESH